MVKNQILLEQLEKLLTYKKSKAFYATKLQITEEEVGELLAELRGKPTKSDIDICEELIAEMDEKIQEINVEKGTLKSSVVSSYEPKNHEELAELHKVDLNKYKISSYWTKQRGNKFTSSLLCTLIKPSDLDPEKFAAFVKQYKSTFSPSKIVTSLRGRQIADVEISLADFHIDKLDIEGESIKNRREQYMHILNNLITKVNSAYLFNKIIFTLGNDFFQTDTYNNTTTKGTPIDYSVPWNNAYEEGFDLMVWAISFLRSFCNCMEIILVNGNHDKTKSYYLAHALEVFFSKDENIKFDRTDAVNKHTMIGNTFVGYNHGDCKIDDLPLIFATSKTSSADFGAATYREIRTGDKHYYLTKEIKGVRIQQLPSLAGTDRWHRDNQFVNNIRAGLALVYHPTKGKVMEVEERI
jgi:hypothetical protein